MIKRILALLSAAALALGISVAAANPAVAAVTVVNDTATCTMLNTHFVDNSGLVYPSKPGTVTMRLVYTRSVNTLGQPTVSPGNHTNASGSFDIRIQNNSDAIFPDLSVNDNNRGIAVVGYLLKDRNSTNTGWENWASAIATVPPTGSGTLGNDYVGDAPSNVRFYPFTKAAVGGVLRYTVDPQASNNPWGYDNFSEGRDVGVGFMFSRYLPTANNTQKPTFSAIIHYYGAADGARNGSLYGIECPLWMVTV